MKKYTVIYTDTPDWARIPAAPMDELPWTERSGVRAYAQLCRTADALLLHLAAAERNIRAEERPPLGMPCRDSCLEFFFCPEEGDERYFNLEFSPSGCIYVGFGRSRTEHSRLLVNGAEELFAPRIKYTADGWEIFFRVPFAFIRTFCPAFSPLPGKSIRANFYKCGDETPAPHYLAWNRVESETPDFHRPQDFGLLTFE